MKDSGVKNPSSSLATYGIAHSNIHWNLSPEELVETSIKKEMGVLSDTGALCVETGNFTGRSPEDRYIVEDSFSKEYVNWNKINQAISPGIYNNLKQKIASHLNTGDVYVKDVYACADDDYRLNIRVIAEYSWSVQFAGNMFRRYTNEELLEFEPDWTVLCAPGCLANPEEDGTRQSNFVIVSFEEKTVIIGGTGYTGEIKKSIFSILNCLLPVKHKVLSMHCSANVGESGDTAIFFGLSGTGKTTLSADPERELIGDDEHGWSDKGVFNFEGGCYAKTIDLTEDKEPDIFRAIRHGAILENIGFFPGTRTPDYSDDRLTQNTRVSYPLNHINNARPSSQATHPSNIFFLTADAFGVLPPMSRLTPGQAMYHFISGYTAKVAGTEEGVKEPQLTFSACFGAPFLPLHPTQYADMLGQKMQQHKVNVWLINTGWTGGPYGVGNRINLKYTRAMISAALNGQLDNVNYATHSVFGLNMPMSCPGVPSELLNPANTWSSKELYESKAIILAEAFVRNFEKYADRASEEILEAAPLIPHSH